MGNLIHVSFDLEVPTNATVKEIEEWVKFELYKSGMSVENPLCDHDLVAKFPTIVIKFER